jgi:hypothetical protein
VDRLSNCLCTYGLICAHIGLYVFLQILVHILRILLVLVCVNVYAYICVRECLYVCGLSIYLNEYVRVCMYSCVGLHLCVRCL